jgi:hypothetical protein
VQADGNIIQTDASHHEESFEAARKAPNNVAM